MSEEDKSQKQEIDDILHKKIFKDKSMSDIYKKIYDNIEEENFIIKQTIESILSSWSNNDSVEQSFDSESVSQNPEILGFIAPLISDYIKSSINNNKLLIDLTTSIQRTISSIISKQKTINLNKQSNNNDDVLTEEERKDLIKTVLNETQKIQKVIDENKNKREKDEQSRKKLFEG